MKELFNWFKKIHKSKTILFSWLLMILGVVELNMHLLQGALGEYYGIAFMLVAISTACLRFLTTESLKSK